MNWRTEQRRVCDLIPAENNPRKLSPKAAKDLRASLEKFGLVEIPAINADGLILAGHQRLRVMAVLGRGQEMIDVRVPDRLLTQAECDEYNIRSNKNTGEWDMEKLLAGFEVADLKAWGFEEVEIGPLPVAEGACDPDECPAPPEEPRTRVGDLWILGEHRVLCGNGADHDDVIRVMGADLATCVFTDPPYGVSIGKKNVMLNSFQKAGRNLTDIVDDDLSPEALKAQIAPAFAEIKNTVMAEDCTVFVCSPQGGGLGMMMMMMMMKEYCYEARHVLIWKKNSPTFSMGRLDYDYQHEPILLTWGKKHKRPMLGTHKTSVWDVDKPMANKEHPTMKPVELYVNAYLNNSESGDVVFDGYGGSGTAVIAAEQTGRRARVIEISPHYVDVIVARWEKFTGKTATLEVR
jgi:site-specific DNA-methyltransferase (adenine-specific)